jgi:hypothetical protein
MFLFRNVEIVGGEIALARHGPCNPAGDVSDGITPLRTGIAGPIRAE